MDKGKTMPWRFELGKEKKIPWYFGWEWIGIFLIIIAIVGGYGFLNSNAITFEPEVDVFEMYNDYIYEINQINKNFDFALEDINEQYDMAYSDYYFTDGEIERLLKSNLELADMGISYANISIEYAEFCGRYEDELHDGQYDCSENFEVMTKNMALQGERIKEWRILITKIVSNKERKEELGW